MNNEYVYFLYGTTIFNEDEVGEIFENGIINPNGYRIKDIMKTIDIPAGDIANRTKAASAAIEGNNIFVIKIPKIYLEPRIINGRLIENPIPIWKKIENTNEHESAIILPPELVYGVYDKQKNKFKLSPNCSPIFDPSGMQYDDSQIEYFVENNFIYWELFAKGRRTRTYENLVEADARMHPWNRTIELNSGHFSPALPRKKVG